MPRFASSDRRVTDGLVLKRLRAMRIDEQGVEFSQDYAHRGLGKGYGPCCKFYRDLNGPTRVMVVSGLPMTDCNGDKCTPGWKRQGGLSQFEGKLNQYTAVIRGRDVELVVKNDDPFGRKKGATLAYSPRLFLGGVEIPAAAPVLVPVDPWNPNYQQNVLDWDYGVCKRRLRTVEGRVHGYWVFPANPGGDVIIRYGQTGDYRLKLGQFKQGEDEEFIPASVFASASYPFEVSDSATYYPDANPETTSVDGYVGRAATIESWASLIASAGDVAVDSGTGMTLFITSGVGSQWTTLYRSITLFDTSGLPDTATISSAVLSIYGYAKADAFVPAVAPDMNIYLSTPASNTALQASDYGQTGSVAQSTSITYANWSTTGYNDFTLNDMTKIIKTGVSKFAQRNANYDVAASSPTWSDSHSAYLADYTAEQGDGYKPKLVVTYTTPTDYPRTASVALGLSV